MPGNPEANSDNGTVSDERNPVNGHLVNGFDRNRSAVKSQTFSRLLLDQKISHGACRLFGVLNLYANQKDQCFPGQRILRKQLGCSFSSMKPWITQLVKQGYISLESRECDRGLLTLYTLHFTGGGVPKIVAGVPTFGSGVPKTRNETVLHRTVSTELSKKKKNAAPQRPFSEPELQEHGNNRKFSFDRQSAEYVRNWIEANDNGGWDQIRNWRTALDRYVEKCRANSRWQQPTYYGPEYQDRYSVFTTERLN